MSIVLGIELRKGRLKSLSKRKLKGNFPTPNPRARTQIFGHFPALLKFQSPSVLTNEQGLLSLR